MLTLLLGLSGIMLLIVIAGALLSVFQRRPPFLRDFEQANRAYVVLAVCATVLFLAARFGSQLQLQSVDIFGLKANVGQLQQKVETLSEQMEAFFKSKRIEVFDAKNWSRVRVVQNRRWHIVLEVTLDAEPIPNSVEIYEGVLLMPEQDYRINGRTVQFPANTTTAEDGLTIKYYPRIAGAAVPSS